LQQQAAGSNSKAFLDHIKYSDELKADHAGALASMRDTRLGIPLPKNKLDNVNEAMAPLYIILVKNHGDQQTPDGQTMQMVMPAGIHRNPMAPTQGAPVDE